MFVEKFMHGIFIVEVGLENVFNQIFFSSISQVWNLFKVEKFEDTQLDLNNITS